MAFQTTVNRVNTFGIQGDLANGQVPHYTPVTPVVAADATVHCGDFVWITDVNGSATCDVKGSGKPDGIVHRELDNPLACTDVASLVVPVGHKAAVVNFGDVFVKTTDTAAVGKKLFVNNTTGAITCGNAGASVSGATETDWVVKSLANNAASASGSVVIASNVG